MYTEIDYSEKQGDEKIGAALSDIVDWFGWTKFAELSRLTREEKITFREFQMAVSIGGVEGYPVRAWWEHLGFAVPADSAASCKD